jgi:hypothetical protein
MSRQVAVLLLVAVIAASAVLASALGWLGNVVVCGADRAPGCITWPMPISDGLWVLFILGVLGLLFWQVRT